MAVLICLFQEATISSFFYNRALDNCLPRVLTAKKSLVEMESEKLEIPTHAQSTQFSLRKVLFSNNFVSLE